MQKDTCSYSYSAMLVKVMGGTESLLRVSTNVSAICESVGTFDDLQATRYCIDLENTVISPQQDLDEEEELENTAEQAEELLKMPFCFIQTSDGKIVVVQHNLDEKISVANLKKGIAAAFQGNFKQTTEKIEEDTQSLHISQYRYETPGEDHVIMYRTVDSKNIIQSAFNGENERPIDIHKSEVVEYKKRVLQSSSGTVKVTVSGPGQSQQFSYQSADSDTYDESFGNNELSGTGKYTLQLQKCSKKTSITKRNVNILELTKSRLYAVSEKENHYYSEMAQLRKNAPSITPFLLHLHSNVTDTSASNLVRTILRLEAQNSPLPGTVPAITEVMDYLSLLSNSSSEKDIEMRVLLYSFLSAEGSINSQKALLKSIQNTKDQKERNTLTVQLGLVANIHPDMLSHVETLITSSSDTTDALILSYGALASSLSPELQHRIISFLVKHINQTTDPSILVHYIHSLGNTQSELANQMLLHLLAVQSTSSVQLAVVYALRYSTGSVEVQSALRHALEANPSEALTEMVLRSIIAGAESNLQPISDQLFETIVTAINRNNTELKMLLAYYIHLLGSNVPNKWSFVLLSHLKKRGTTWNEKNQLYDLIQDVATRESDLNLYPSNKAYIWRKSFGISRVGLDTAFGAFAGFGGSTNPSSFKLFAKGVARAHAFKYSKTVFEALLLSEKKPGEDYISNNLYVNIAGKVLIDYQKQIPTCRSWTNPLYHSPTCTLFKVSTSVFIYVGLLSFEVSLTARLNIGAASSACIQKCVSAKGALLPSVTVEATGTATGSIVELVRGGIGLTASFTYQVTLDLTESYLLPQGPHEFCIRLLHGWPDNKISIYVYYQIRSIKMCKARIPYPCRVKSCQKSVSYPCGLKCKKLRKCSVKKCRKSVGYPCGVKTCSKSLSYVSKISIRKLCNCSISCLLLCLFLSSPVDLNGVKNANGKQHRRSGACQARIQLPCGAAVEKRSYSVLRRHE
ncbi:hypothetical protein EMCRGX_G009276 [Ephydatia muelleri]